MNEIEYQRFCELLNRRIANIQCENDLMVETRDDSDLITFNKGQIYALKSVLEFAKFFAL